MFPRSRPSDRKKRWQNSFSLVELLVVMAIIAVLAALTIGAASGVMQHAARSRAASELAAMKTGLDSYKVDNGGYPVSDGVLATNNYASSDGSGTEYQTNAEIVYQALQGKTNYSDTTIGKAYMNFRANQVEVVRAARSWPIHGGWPTGILPGPPARHPITARTATIFGRRAASPSRDGVPTSS